jgi:precorrin-3B synthase
VDFLSVGLRSIRAVPTPEIRRRDADACPGALRLHAAADGPLARVRLPGGMLTGAQLTVLRELAETWGDGHLELTSRANVQLRALKTAPAVELATRLWAAGLLPSETHELVRNIAASPFAGPPTRALVADLDRALCADPELAALPGRFLFAIDDGSGDGGPAADVAAIESADLAVAIVFPGADLGLRVTRDRVVPALLAAAHGFLDERAATGAAAWRLRELADGPARVAARTAATLGLRLAATAGAAPDSRVAAGDQPGGSSAPTEGPGAGSRRSPGARVAAGIVELADGRGAVSALVRLGRLDRVQMEVLEKAELLVVAPWRGVVVPDLAPQAARDWLRRLADAGFEVSAGSRWSGVTACAGQPGCASALADVRADAAMAVLSEVEGQEGVRLPVHWVGCARGCGSPSGTHVRVEATPSGYTVTPDPAGVKGCGGDALAALVAAARRT